MKSLVRLLSFNSYLVAAGVLGLALAAVLARGGMSGSETAALGLYVVAALVAWRALRTPHEKVTRFDGLAAFDKVVRSPRPTLLEFYSDNCAVCMTMRPVVNRLKQDAGNRLQVLHVDTRDEIGRQLAERYDVRLTPTFVLINSYGSKEEEFTLVLDRPRVLHWLDQQTLSP